MFHFWEWKLFKGYDSLVVYYIMPKKSTVKDVPSKKATKVVTAKSATPPPVPAKDPVPTKDPVPAKDPVPTPAHTKAEDIESRYTSLLASISCLVSTAKGIQGEVRRIQKDTKKALKDAEKKSRGKKGVVDPNKPKRAPSGFAKPAPISEELCKFLGVDNGTELARTDVTKQVTKYIKDHSLQNPSNKRHILPNETLKKLLKIGEGQEVTYFNLQTYMKVHFPKSVKA